MVISPQNRTKALYIDLKASVGNDSSSLMQKQTKTSSTRFIAVSPFDLTFEELTARADNDSISVSPCDKVFGIIAEDSCSLFESVSPWDNRFPMVEDERNSFSPFDERFPQVTKAQQVSNNETGMVRANHRSCHHSIRSRLRAKRNKRARQMRRQARNLKLYAKEPVVRRRMSRRSFKQVPEGLRFPSPGHVTAFESVSPFDTSFPNSKRNSSPTAATAVKRRKRRHRSNKSREGIKGHLNTPAPSMVFGICVDPFPAFSPLAAGHPVWRSPWIFQDEGIGPKSSHSYIAPFF